MRFLLVNPWVADVAAYNFWLRPLGLYRLAEWLWERGAALRLVDCLSPFPAPGKFKRQKKIALALPCDAPENLCAHGISEDEFVRRVDEAGDADAILVTSAISYWYPGALAAIKILKRLHPDTPIVLGGVYPTLWPDHAKKNSGADFTLGGPISNCSAELAGILGLPAMPTREKKWWFELRLHDGATFAAVRTAEGCPFSCTYCASALVSGAFSPHSVVDSAREIEALAEVGVKEVAFYDDALLVDAGNRFIPLMERLKGLGLTFHTPNGLHARLIDAETAETLARGNFKTIRLSLETVSAPRQKSTGGKVTSSDIETALENLAKAGAVKENIGVYLLMGLPGQSICEVEESILWVKSLGVRPHLAEYSPIPGTPEFARLIQEGLLPVDLDPIWTNNSLYCERFGVMTRAEIQRLKALARN